jgi:hypothetical protein
MQEWFILAFFAIVVGIPVLAGTLGRAHKNHLKLKERQLDMLGSETAEKAARYAAHTERLEQRVRVLERIVTDKGIVVADEIESLREKPLN